MNRLSCRSAAVRAFCFTLILLLSCSPVVFGQATTGSIYGTVADSGGAVVPGATVTVKNVNTGETKSATTSSTGDYTVVFLVPGEYEVSAEMAGFQVQRQTAVHLAANQNVHVNFDLKVGSTEQSLTVEAGITLVDTRESQIATTVEQTRIQDLPLNGRNAYDLVQVVPGVQSYAADKPTGSRQGTQFTVNGVPDFNSAYYLDGAYDTNLWRFGGNLMPSPDALQEFRVLTSNFDAEFGRSAGGVVNAITRSGTNNYHGLLYDYLRNDALNSKNYFINEVTPLRQNQFGGTFGGPIVRDKAFFFLSYEGLRIRTPVIVSSSSLITPTPAQARGDFSAEPQSKWPKMANGSYYSCNGVQGIICPTLLDPVAQNALAFVPLADPVTGITAEQFGNANTEANQGMAKIDWQATVNHRLAGTFFISRGTSKNPLATQAGISNQILSYSGVQEYEGQYNGVLNDTWTISPTKVNNLRLFYTLSHFVLSSIYGSDHQLDDLGSLAPPGSDYGSQPLFNVVGYWSMGTNNAGPNDLPSSSLGISDTFSTTLGNHEVKLGGSWVYNHFRSRGGAASNGLFTFNGTVTGNALADFLLGRANNFRQNNGVDFRTEQHVPSLFFSDNWRLSRRLSLNLGLRWERFPSYTGQNNTATFIPYVKSERFPTAPLGLVFSGDQGLPDGIIKTPWNTFAPRFGFAYDVFGDGKTSIRGGYGLFYSQINQVRVSNNLVQQPYSLTMTINRTPSLLNPYGVAGSPFPYNPDPSSAVFTSGATIFGLEPGADDVPSVQQFSLGLQQQLAADWAAEVSYVGSVARHFPINIDGNSPIYAPGGLTTTAGLNARRPYQPTPTTYTFGVITQTLLNSNFSYNSLQAKLTHRFTRNFSVHGSYVWSKSIGLNAVVDSYDIQSSRGLSDTDIRHSLVVSYMYSLPRVNSLGAFGRQVLSGWQLNGITAIRSGTPFNVTSGKDTNLDGVNNDRPDTVAPPSINNGSRQERIAQYFNPAAFAQLPANTPYGNTGYNSMIGPGYVNTDLSIFKNFTLPFRESSVQFRAEAFNLFNNVNLSNPNGVMTNAQFGKITSAGSPRIVQFALRFSF
ncbi:MAG TPA: carboxypeptidase regulatory-like domain-containing protein [Terriglobales bacterium]|nr:carboxypeptidase regulatory-like domain-containing protein [Terriglobales bacterium]